MRAWKLSVLPVVALLTAAALYAGQPTKTPAPPNPPAAPAALSDPDAALPTDNNFVMHEWGTFTSFSGSDGVSLEFRPLLDEDLPTFVMDRQKQALVPTQRIGNPFSKGRIISKQRMETPVAYFYTDRERIVDVKVDFPRGLLTEFYPPVRSFGPPFRKDQPEPLENSFLRWGKIRLIPPAQALGQIGVDRLIPKVSNEESQHYAFARETDSAHIQLTDVNTAATHREKFLFYRGVGNFDLPVTLKSSGDGHFTLSYSGKTPLHYAFLVQATADTIRFQRYDALGPVTEMALPKTPATLDSLSESMVSALVSDGLYEKEARAMVKTWRTSWFGEPGTRVLYALPQTYTDALLPLRITPAPKESLRVMIGRLEALTPEQERTAESLAAQLGNDDSAAREKAALDIRRLGRFAEPTLTQVAKTSTSPETQTRAQAMLKQLLLEKQ